MLAKSHPLRHRNIRFKKEIMSNITQNIKSYKVVYPQIYSYTLPELKPNKGSQKIGYTEQKNVHDRRK